MSVTSRGRGPVVLAKYVLEALKKRTKGDQMNYQDVIGQLAKKDIKVVVLRRWLQALKMCVSQFNKECDDLVGATLHLPWADQEQEMVELYIEYLADLLSAQTYYLKSVLNMLVVQLFKPVPQESERVYRNTHQALKTILGLIPMSPSYLFKVLESKAPFRNKPTDQQEVFVRNCLHIISYCPTLSDDVIHLLVHKMTLIDVELPPRSVLEMDTQSDTTTQEDMFDVELDADIASSHVAWTSHTAVTATPTLCLCHSLRDIMTNPYADKLDVMMLTVFEYFEGICFNDGKLNSDAAMNLFQSLVKSFEDLILPTHATSHVQFLLYRMTSFDSLFSGYFLDFLWDKICLPNVVEKFAAIASKHEIAFCYTIMEENNRGTATSSSSANTPSPLKQCFPFDPYCLKRSAVLINKNYQSWEENNSEEKEVVLP